MRKLLLFIYIACVAASTTYSQTSYHLDKIILTVHDYNTKSPVFVKNLNDSVQILTSDWDFPILPVFKTVILEENKIASAQLLNDSEWYNLDAEENVLMLTEVLSSKKETTLMPTDNKEITESLNGLQLPYYTIQQSGDKMIITFENTVYGSSKYPKRSLEGTCQMIYTKP